MFTICAVLAGLCLWLVGKLAVYSQAQHVVHRERARIARDIHDDLTAGLTQLVLFGEVARSELPEAIGTPAGKWPWSARKPAAFRG